MISSTLLNGVNYVLTLDHVAEDRVLAIKPWSGNVSDKKLASIGAGSGVGHGENTGIIMLQRIVNLIIKLVAGAAGAIPTRICLLYTSDAADE